MKAVVLSEIEDTYLAEIAKLCDVVKAGACAGKPELAGEELSLLMKDNKPDILIADSTPVTSTVLKDTPNLKLVICTRGNPVNVEKNCLVDRGIHLTHTPARNANGVAEFTLGLIISCLRMIHRATASIKDGTVALNKSPKEISANQKDVIWYHPELKAVPYELFRGKELTSTSLGLIGVGAVGKLVAQKASLLGMRVFAHDPYISREAKTGLSVEFLDLKDLIARSDVISLHAKATEDSFHLVNKDFLNQMKKEAYLINTSRGSLVNTEDLIAALKEKRISGAALDVFEYEPLSVQDELLHINNVLVTPHIGGASTDVCIHHSRMVWETVKAFCEGRELPYRV